MENLKQALKKAKELPTHVNGILQERVIHFEKSEFECVTLYGDEATPVAIFEALRPRYSGATRYYIKEVPTKRADGTLNKKEKWEKKLMFHKAWSRTDIEVKEVKFSIVGLKRTTTHLPAGVIITDIKFVH